MKDLLVVVSQFPTDQVELEEAWEVDVLDSLFEAVKHDHTIEKVTKTISQNQSWVLLG